MFYYSEYCSFAIFTLHLVIKLSAVYKHINSKNHKKWYYSPPQCASELTSYKLAQYVIVKLLRKLINFFGIIPPKFGGIGDHRKFRPSHAMVVKLYHPYTRFLRTVTFAYLVGESRLFRRIVTFLISAPYKYSYLLTVEFLVDKILMAVLWHFTCKTHGGN